VLLKTPSHKRVMLVLLKNSNVGVAQKVGLAKSTPWKNVELLDRGYGRKDLTFRVNSGCVTIV